MHHKKTTNLKTHDYAFNVDLLPNSNHKCFKTKIVAPSILTFEMKKHISHDNLNLMLPR